MQDQHSIIQDQISDEHENENHKRLNGSRVRIAIINMQLSDTSDLIYSQLSFEHTTDLTKKKKQRSSEMALQRGTSPFTRISDAESKF